jgi:hypothetical protein
MVEEQQQAVEAPDADSPYNAVLKTWARWMRLDDKQHPSGEANPQDVKEFMSCAEAVETMINDLPRIQWWALRRAHGLATAWRFPETEFAPALQEAESRLTPRLIRNVATRRYFV